MSGKRLLDAARIYGALKSVARTHVAIRSQQIDAFSKTSTLAKAAKSQTDRVTVTAGAAYALARRLSETEPARSYSSYATGSDPAHPVPRQDHGHSGHSTTHDLEGIAQDHHYRRSEQNGVEDEPPTGELDVLQEKSKQYPLPDGTISPNHSTIGQPIRFQGKDTFSERGVGASSSEPLLEDDARRADLDVTQNRATRQPLPDGSIPPVGAPIGRGRQATGSDTFTDRPGGTTKHPLDQEHKADQELTPRESNASTIPDPSYVPGRDTFAERSSGAARHPLNQEHQAERELRPKESSGSTIPDPSYYPGEDTFTDRPVGSKKDPLDQEHQTERELCPRESNASTIPDPSFAARKAQQLSEFQIPSEAATTEPHKDSPDTFSERSHETDPSLSGLPRSKIPKTVEGSEGKGGLEQQNINQDVYYSPSPGARRDSMSAEDIPEGVDLNVFHSPQVAGILKSGGTDDRRRAYEMKMNAARRQRTQRDNVATTASGQPSVSTRAEEDDTRNLAQSLAADAAQQQQNEEVIAPDSPISSYQMHESKVPESRLGRIWQFGGLATSMAFGAVGETFRRVTGGASDGSVMLSEANMTRLVAKLSRMRGAALKLGQMMSFQDSKLLPPAINAVLQRVQDSADYMPPSQRNRVMASSLGDNWKELFSSFDDVPIAAASIGQVHKATLASNGQQVAVKVQYPGVRGSIDSDLNNLSLLLTASRLLPKGLYLDKTIANARTELAWECDYVREAECGKRFAELAQDETSVFTVPKVFGEASGPQVLTAEFMSGTGVTKVKDLSQQERDWIGTQILRLCLRELMEWRFMQTDPNWTNFLYNRKEKKLELLDFGASREYPEDFVKPYVELLIAASKKDRATCRDRSIELGYLTGLESKAMLDAHVDSVLTLAEPFMEDVPLDAEGAYDFRDQTITDRVRAKIGLMVRERLAPPPEETYSLHRKLSGAFLLCARLGSRIKTREMFVAAVEKWRNGR
ncbi:ABC1-domain-containing protein [Myriangium duriaei CBS 260.36]|uniref:ABC1-domain-containing protein n=1 Tax=Myriangium duriaei CBS 260.36 TaxID=1168546 RepID=A0A9P4JFC0_9PEZI|nr:ABC1-domain-containing protein [Myriangium duriaei CBS 260.36]